MEPSSYSVQSLLQRTDSRARSPHAALKGITPAPTDSRNDNLDSMSACLSPTEQRGKDKIDEKQKVMTKGFSNSNVSSDILLQPHPTRAPHSIEALHGLEPPSLHTREKHSSTHDKLPNSITALGGRQCFIGQGKSKGNGKSYNGVEFHERDEEHREVAGTICVLQEAIVEERAYHESCRIFAERYVDNVVLHFFFLILSVVILIASFTFGCGSNGANRILCFYAALDIVLLSVTGQMKNCPYMNIADFLLKSFVVILFIFTSFNFGYGYLDGANSPFSSCAIMLCFLLNFQRYVAKCRLLICVNKRILYDPLSSSYLDMSYVTSRCLAMALPTDRFPDLLYRNRIEDVSRFFEKSYPGAHIIVNMCDECSYPTSYFYRVQLCPTPDHQVPAIKKMEDLCREVEQFLKKRPNSVVAFHCKGGKGRTGLVVACWLLYSKFCKTAIEGIKLVAERRTDPALFGGVKTVTQPCQIRFLRYFEELITRRSTTEDKPQRQRVVYLKNAKITGLPTAANLRDIYLRFIPGPDNPDFWKEFSTCDYGITSIQNNKSITLMEWCGDDETVLTNKFDLQHGTHCVWYWEAVNERSIQEFARGSTALQHSSTSSQQEKKDGTASALFVGQSVCEEEKDSVEVPLLGDFTAANTAIHNSDANDTANNGNDNNYGLDSLAVVEMPTNTQNSTNSTVSPCSPKDSLLRVRRRASDVHEHSRNGIKMRADPATGDYQATGRRCVRNSFDLGSMRDLICVEVCSRDNGSCRQSKSCILTTCWLHSEFLEIPIPNLAFKTQVLEHKICGDIPHMDIDSVNGYKSITVPLIGKRDFEKCKSFLKQLRVDLTFGVI